MTLSGQEFKKVKLALIEAFPTTVSLEEMLLFELEKNLREIAGEGSLQDIVFKLIQTANAQGWFEDLVRAASNSNSGNSQLKILAQELLPSETSSKNQVVTAVMHEEFPYRGLEAFDKQHAKLFFGRKKVVEDILQKLDQARFVPIIGASGSGKSSVVRAGLIPQLENNGWRILDPIKPDTEPLAELKRAFKEYFPGSKSKELYDYIHTQPNGLHAILERLPSVEKRFLLVVDQFEEVFSLCPKEEERSRFIEFLTSCLPDRRLAIITTMRADFLESCLHYPSLTQLIQNHAVYIPPLVGADLEQAITEPANLQGYQFETGLLGAILQDISLEKEYLPLLQFALTELWSKRDSHRHQLTLEQYKTMGGVVGALDCQANSIYDNFTPKQQVWIKRIFLKLVRTGEGVKDTRQRQPKSKLLAIGSDQVISDILDELIRGRLLVAGQENQQVEAWVDLAHEALMEGWQKFAQWRQENRELRRLVIRVDDALGQWQTEPKDENLMMGGLLAQVKEKWRELEPDLDPITKDFYQQSDQFQQQQFWISIRQTMEALVKISKALAHELNNPGAAARRAASQLKENFQNLQNLGLHLNSLSTEQLKFIINLQSQAIKDAVYSPKLDPLTQSDLEDEVTDWLENHDVSNGWKLSSTLVCAGFNTYKLDTIADNIPAECLVHVLTWLEATLASFGLINEIEQSTTRISELVKVIQGYSYTDQVSLQEIDIHEAIENTLLILQHRLKKGIFIHREYDRTLPRINAYGSELNQVWTNLIDNAIDAMEGKGDLTIHTYKENTCLIVEMTDTGAGIPPAIQSRIFEPFFTTKDVGKGMGMGMGLEIVYRIVVHRYHGDIHFDSKPGSTCFQVRLPWKKTND